MGRLGLRDEWTRLLTVTIALGFCLSAMLGLSTSYVPEMTDTAVRESPTSAKALALTVHDPIYIDGNAGFTNGSGVVWGSGTESDPYIIEGWDISAATAAGIQIQNTTARFVVRSCSVSDGAAMMVYNPGIYLWNCTNGTLVNSSCVANENGIYIQSSNNITLNNDSCIGNRGSGIHLDTSKNNTLTNNDCSNSIFGIWLATSSNNIVSNNNCSNNGNEGIYLDSSSNHNTLSNNTCSNQFAGIYLNTSSDNNTLSNNTCSNNSYGINLVSSSNDTVSNNNCSNNYHGINLQESSCSNTLDNNNCSWNDQYGIDVSASSNNNTLNNNACSSNLQCGIHLVDSSRNNAIFENMVSDNVGFGLYIEYYPGLSTDNHIWNNTFYHNNGAGDVYDASHIQASDDCPGNGTSNWWNSSDGYGNYWSDWTTPDNDSDGIVDEPYVIDGVGGARDYYPLTTTHAPIPEFGMVPFVVMALLAAIVLTIGARRRKPY